MKMAGNIRAIFYYAVKKKKNQLVRRVRAKRGLGQKNRRRRKSNVVARHNHFASKKAPWLKRKGSGNH